MRVLAFDLGSSMAAVWGDNQIAREVKYRAFEGQRSQKLKDIRTWLYGRFCEADDNGVDAVIFERPFCRGLAATRLLWGIAALIEELSEQFGIACVDIGPSAIKKWATGNGKATKEDMITEAIRRSGSGSFNEHEADAYLLCHYGMENIRSKK